MNPRDNCKLILCHVGVSRSLDPPLYESSMFKRATDYTHQLVEDYYALRLQL